MMTVSLAMAGLVGSVTLKDTSSLLKWMRNTSVTISTYTACAKKFIFLS